MNYDSIDNSYCELLVQKGGLFESPDEGYKKLQVAAFVQLPGSSVSDVLLTLHCLLAAFLAAKSIISVHEKSEKPRLSIQRLSIEFLFVCLPSIIALTYPSARIYILMSNILLIILCFPFILKLRDPEKIQVDFDRSQKAFLSEYRSLMMILVIACILAVDFQVFPRSFAKTEDFGTSLMDIGVGSFVLSNSVIAGRSSMAKSGTVMQKVYRSTKSKIPILILGFIRLISVKGMEYQEHVSEYGVHWNFFFTIAFVSLFAVLSSSFLSHSYMMIFSAFCLLFYQYALSNLGLNDFILYAERDNLFSMNREGILSLAGYFPLYIFGYYLGKYFLKNRTLNGWYKVLAEISCLQILVIGALYTCTDYLGVAPSRRMANLTYVLQVFAMSLSLIIGLLFAQLFLVSRPTRVTVVDSVNQNQLAIFLLANLLTGLTNMTMRTLCVPDFYARIYLTLYMFVTCAIAVCFFKCNVKLKFW